MDKAVGKAAARADEEFLDAPKTAVDVLRYRVNYLRREITDLQSWNKESLAKVERRLGEIAELSKVVDDCNAAIVKLGGGGADADAGVSR